MPFKIETEPEQNNLSWICLANLKSMRYSGGAVECGMMNATIHQLSNHLKVPNYNSAGLTVHNLGVDIEPEEFVRQVKEKNATILCLSALLTTTMPMMKQTIDAVIESGLWDQVKIMVGGAPVTQAFADDIGADVFASDAGSAAKRAKALVN